MTTVELIEKFDKSLGGYKDNYTLRGLFQFALVVANPLVAAPLIGIETALLTWLENRNSKWRIIAEELDRWKFISEDLLSNADFLFCFKQVIEATEQTQSHEKIRNYAKLLKSAIQPDIFSNLDEYQECLTILKELSPKEFVVLKTLKEYEEKYPHDQKLNDFGNADRYWINFRDEIAEKNIVNHNEILATLVRLNRTGCFRSTPPPMHDDKKLGHGKLTPIYYKLVIILDDKF